MARTSVIEGVEVTPRVRRRGSRLVLVRPGTTNGRQPMVRPFLKWAGGKGQLLEQLEVHFPEELKQGKVQKYFEPFLGGGAVFFHIMLNYGASIREVYLSDINPELILTYLAIKNDVTAVISNLERLRTRFLGASSAQQEEFYYAIRHKYNESVGMTAKTRDRKARAERASQMLFLNRTCYNGLFRVNRQGEFNVPFGRYKNPQILNTENLQAASYYLRNAEVVVADFEAFKDLPDKKSFVYFDPPYRPITKSSSFTAYSKDEFGDEQQIRLSHFFSYLAQRRHAKVMLSNSDPKSENPKDDFFEQLYGEFQLHRVQATRMINCVGERRGKITELLITNF